MSKSLAYLVALVVAVVGAFYVMNYVNNQKIASNPRAAGYDKDTCKLDIIVKKVGDKCYGNNGYIASSLYQQNATKTNINDDKCYLKQIPCQYDATNVTSKYVSSSSISSDSWAATKPTCTAEAVVWTKPETSGEAITPTGSTVGTGSNAFFAYKEICARQTGRYVKVYRYASDGAAYTKGYRCETSSRMANGKSITEVDCRNGITRTFQGGAAAISKAPLNDDNRDQLVNTNSLSFDFTEACPKGSLVWLSVLRLVDQSTDTRTLSTIASMSNNSALKWGSWDQCMKLTGKAQLQKNPANGASTYRCQAQPYQEGTTVATKCKR